MKAWARPNPIRDRLRAAALEKWQLEHFPEEMVYRLEKTLEAILAIDQKTSI